MHRQDTSPSELALDCARAITRLGQHTVRGIVRRAKRSDAGVIYVTLADEAGAELRCRWHGADKPDVGSRIAVTGTPTIYAAGSELQFTVERWEVEL